MSLLYNNPALFWLMALAAIPILVHLFARSRPPKHRFSDITFLKRIIKKTSRVRKPQDRLVLLLRTLAAAALLAIFVQPFLVSEDPNRIAGADDNVIIIIDRSASMSAQQGSTSRFTEACNEASELLTKLKPDNANIIWINSTPNAVFPAPGPNLTFLKESLQTAEPTSDVGAISASIKLALEQLKNVNGNREIIIISDFQKQAWENAELDVPEAIKFTKLAVGDTDLANIAISSIATTPSSPVTGQDVAISCQIKNFSNKPKSTTIYLNAGGGRQSKDIEIPANGQTEVEFRTQFSHHGDVAVTASLTEDSFKGDDERFTIIPVRESLSLCSLTPLGASPAEAKSKVHGPASVLQRLASALPWLSHTVTAEIPPVGVHDILFIHEWNGQDIETLTKLSNNGTTIIVTPSSSCQLQQLQQLLNLPASSNALTQKDNPEGWRAGITKETSSLFSIFSSGEFGNPAQGNFRQRFQLPSEWLNASIISYTDKIPAILLNNTSKSSSKSKRLIWNLPFDPNLSDWISQEPFVTFMAELLLYIQPSKMNLQFELLPGSPVNWLVPENIDPSTVALHPLSGENWAIKLSNTKQGASLQSTVPATPGIFEWRTGNTIAHTNFVNFPTSESDLSLLDPAALKQGQSAEASDILKAEALSQGIPMWPWLVSAVLLLLIAEAFAATTKRNKPSSNTSTIS